MDNTTHISLMPPLVSNITNQSTCDMWRQYHRESYEKFYVIDMCSMSLCVVNVMTNLAAYLIFYQDRNVGTFNRLLMNLSLCECCFQVFYFMYTAVENYLLLQGRLIFASYNSAVVFSSIYLYVLIPILTSSHIARNWAVILISLYRFETLCRAFSTGWLIFVKDRDIKICIVINIVSILISVPRYIERNVFICISLEENLYTVIGFGGRAVMVEAYKYIYHVTALFIFQNGGPAIIVCSIGALILIKLADRKKIKDRLMGKTAKDEQINIVNENDNESAIRKSNKKHFALFHREKQHNQSQRKVNRKNSTASRGGRLVVILSVLFVVCELPSFFNKLFGIIGVLQDSSFSEYLIISSNLATLLDSFVNFFIYLLSNQRFRQTLIDRLSHLTRRCKCQSTANSARYQGQTDLLNIRTSRLMAEEK